MGVVALNQPLFMKLPLEPSLLFFPEIATGNSITFVVYAYLLAREQYRR